MRKILFILVCLSSFVLAHGQEIFNISRSFRASSSVNIGVKPDTTLYVNYYFKKGRLAEVRIDFVSVDRNVKSGYFMCTDNNIRNFINLRNALTSVIKKYEEWSKTAIDNKVDFFIKEFGSYENISFHRIFKIKDKGIYTSMYGGVSQPYTEMTPSFLAGNIDGKYLTCVIMGGDGGYIFQYKTPDGYVPSLWSGILTHASGADKDEIKHHRFGLMFYSIEDLQTLIDALDFSSVKKEYDEWVNKKKNYDELFK